MTLEMNRPKCCCFTGHRENKLKRSEKEILEDLKQAINQAIDDGYTTFITGMAWVKMPSMHAERCVAWL